MFLVNSRLSLFVATPSGSYTLTRYPFSLSYGVILPSSFARVHSFALVSSTHLPVSVCGTVTNKAPLAAFLGSLGSASLRPCGLPVASQDSITRICLCYLPRRLRPPIPTEGCAYLPASPLQSNAFHGGTGLLTRFPSTTPFGLALGPTYPGRIPLPQETLGLRRSNFSSEFMLLMPAYSLLIPPNMLSHLLLRPTECSPTEYKFIHSRSFG